MFIDSDFDGAEPKVVSLFSGIGGFELGLKQAGFQTVLMCESDEFAQAVLRHHFPDVALESDVTSLESLPDCDILTAGWPCQDISQAGTARGLEGERSGLISEVFRLLASADRKPKIVLLENVAFAVELRKGEVVRHVTSELEKLGYRWSYRILNTRMFGIPQRRRRLYILAALDCDPAAVLFEGAEHPGLPEPTEPRDVGFYWTEGNRGLGWSPDAVPPLKGGSGVGIPSPPAVWNKESGSFTTPGIEDVERLQGFPTNWTLPAESLARGGRKRWMLTGNAVSVPIVRWLGERLMKNGLPNFDTNRLPRGRDFGRAGQGGPGLQPSFYEPSSEGPGHPSLVSLGDFGLVGQSPLSTRAMAGFTRRFEAAPLRKNPDFLRDLRRCLEEAHRE